MNAPTSTIGADTPVFDCRQTVRRLWDYLDGQLGPVDTVAIDAHLRECERCPPHFVFERRFLDAVRASRDATMTPDAGKIRALGERVAAMLAAGERRTTGDT